MTMYDQKNREEGIIKFDVHGRTDIQITKDGHKNI